MVKLRLQRVGKKKQVGFRIVVADARAARSSKVLEIIGYIHNKNFLLKEDRLNWWLSKGAQITPKLKARIEHFRKINQVAKDQNES